MAESFASDPLMEDRRNGVPLCEVTTHPHNQDYEEISKRFLLHPSTSSYHRNKYRSTLSSLCQTRPDNFRRDQGTLNELITLGHDLDYIDTQWYGWEALHYAAYSCDPAMLKQLVDRLISAGTSYKINTLTALSENALHVLLEHGKVAQSFNVSCRNGPESRAAKIISRERDDVVACAEILIGADVDVNHSNFWNETPILIAIKRKYYRIVGLLMRVKGVDLDSCRGTISGKTARELLKGKIAGGTCPERSLFQLLKSGDEERFLKSKMLRSVDVLDGDNEENSSCTLLQYCFRRGLIARYHEKPSLDCDLHFPQDITANRIVQVFCQKGMARCIQHLLNHGANINFELRKFGNGRSLLVVAILKSYYPLVALILGRKDIILRNDQILQMCYAMNELLKISSHINDVNSTITLVLNRLLSADLENSEKIIESLMELLGQGVKILNKENILLLLRFPSSLCRIKVSPTELSSSSKIKKSILEEIDPEVLKTHFDDCIERRGDKVHINYESFIVGDSAHFVLETLLGSPSLHEYFRHPVFKILIMRKWNQLHVSCLKWKYFYINLCFHLIFYLSLNAYILCKFNTSPVAVLHVFALLCWILFVLKNIFQIFADFWIYVKDKTHYAEIFFIIFTLMVFVCESEWTDAFAVLSVLGSNLVLLLLLHQVPDFAKYIIILQTIVFYLRYIFFYFIQFLAFAVCFYILFSKSDQVLYRDLPDKIFETVILFSGNLDYMKTPWKDEDALPLYHNFDYKELFSKIIFVVFVLFLAIILQNLLLGLLVTDMSDLSNTVKLYEQKARANFVVRLHTFLQSPFVKCIPNIGKHKKTRDPKDIVVSDEDRKALDEEEKQHLDFILHKKGKRVNNLKKLYNYITMKISNRTLEIKYDDNKDILEKLELIDEKLKYFFDIK